MKKVKKNNRQKAFWGAIIGAGVSALSNIIGSVINGNAQRTASEAQLRAQEKLLKRQENLNEDSQRLQSEIAEQANQGIYDELRQKNYKCGGKIKVRKKAEWGTEDTSSLLSGLIGGLGNIGTSAINSNTALQINANNLKLQELETAAKNKQYQYGYVQSDFAKRMRKYLNGEDNTNEFDNSKRAMFPNKQLYM